MYLHLDLLLEFESIQLEEMKIPADAVETSCEFTVT